MMVRKRPFSQNSQNLLETVAGLLGELDKC